MSGRVMEGVERCGDWLIGGVVSGTDRGRCRRIGTRSGWHGVWVAMDGVRRSDELRARSGGSGEYDVEHVQKF